MFRWANETFSKIPNSVIDLFQCLSSDSPVCSYISPNDEVKKISDRLFDSNLKSDPELMRSIQKNVPIIFEIISCLQIETCLPDCFKGLIIDLIDLSFHPFLNAYPVKTPQVDSSNEICR